MLMVLIPFDDSIFGFAYYCSQHLLQLRIIGLTISRSVGTIAYSAFKKRPLDIKLHVQTHVSLDIRLR